MHFQSQIRQFQFLLLIFIIFSFISSTLQTLPVAVFHGIGDACDFPGTTDFVDYLKEKLKILK